MRRPGSMAWIIFKRPQGEAEKLSFIFIITKPQLYEKYVSICQQFTALVNHILLNPALF
jgi:hypothetical protein